MAIWRLIPALAAPAAVQMAIDAWLLDQHAQNPHLSTLRFYSWSPLALSLGYHQRHWPTEWNHLTWQGQPISLVRRPTGGRAVLHQGDLTYAIATSQFPGRRGDVYRSLCEFLIHGWRTLGVDLIYGQAGKGYIHNPNCFGTATVADLVMSNGAKFIGSAQAWRGKTVLQHGSMRLQPDAQLFQQVFGAEGLPLPTLPIALAGEAGMATAIAALTQAASECFGVTFVEQPLSPTEWQAISSSTAALQVTKRDTQMLKTAPEIGES